MDPTLVILAAGAGSRFGGLKQLAPIGQHGEALMEYTVFDAMKAGFSRVILVVRPDTEETFRERFATGMARRVPIVYAHQTLSDLPKDCALPGLRERPWGTGQAVLAVEDAIEGPFAVLNADDLYGAESFTALAKYLESIGDREQLELAVVGFRVAQTLTDAGAVSRALCQLGSNGLLREIVEIKKVWRREGRIVYLDGEGNEELLAGDEVVSMNMWGFSSDIFPELRRRFLFFLEKSGGAENSEFLLPDMVRDLLHEDLARVEVLPGSDRWCGITFREDQAKVRAIISTSIDQGLYPKELWA